MRKFKTYIVSLFILTFITSFAQKITINNNKNAIVYLAIKDIKINLMQHKITKINTQNNVKYTVNSDVSNVICNINNKLEFVIKNTDLNIKIIKLDKKNGVYQYISNSTLLLNQIKFKTKKEDHNYRITIPKIQKGVYAIIINNSLNWNLFEIN